MEAVGLLEKIVGLAGSIRSRVKTVKANKKQCERLAERIDTIVQSLQGLKETGLPSTAQFTGALKRLEITLKECSDYIQKFTEKSKFKQFFKAKKYKNRFQEFNEQLGQAVIDLSLGLNIHQVVINPEQDIKDRATDDAQLAEILDLQKEGLEGIKALREALAEQKAEQEVWLASLKGHVIHLAQLAQTPRGTEEKKEKEEKKPEKKPDDKKSAETSDDSVLAEAYYQAGLAHQDKEEWKEAAENHRKATEKGHVEARTTLGFFHLKGLGGIKQDKAAAFTLFFQSAQSGHHRAQYNLGAMYENGDGISKDIEKAREWYQKAADQGNEKAKKRLQNQS